MSDGNLYHVTPKWDGKDLMPLGDADEFVTRWPEAEAIADYHCVLVHMYDDIQDARRHQSQHGGEILVIDPEYLDTWIDDLEECLPHPVARRVDADHVVEVIRQWAGVVQADHQSR